MYRDLFRHPIDHVAYLKAFLLKHVGHDNPHKDEVASATTCGVYIAHYELLMEDHMRALKAIASLEEEVEAYRKLIKERRIA